MQQYNQKNIINNEVAPLQFFPLTPIITVPTEITVHLGAPDEDAPNVTVPYIDYIKNVGSSELYPTWPENALKANIHAITSIAMNRINTEWYRSKGYNFDITNSPRYDQAYIYNRGIFDSIDDIVNELFNQYIVRSGQYRPLYAEFCDGRITQCAGLYQWGSVDLANQGYTPIEILRYYYGDDIDILTDAPVGSLKETYPGEPLQLGESNLEVLTMQIYLDIIRANYPAIPQIYPLEGYYDETTEAAVREFQRIFNLPITGIINKATWYKIIYIYTAVTKLAELTGAGLSLEEIRDITARIYLKGDIRPGVEIIQYGLNVLSAYYDTIPEIAITGIFDSQTRNAIIEFQKTMELPVTGIVNWETYNILYQNVISILDTLPPQAVYLPHLRWTGVIYDLGRESPAVYLIQEMLLYISLIIPSVPPVELNSVYDEATRKAVTAFQAIEGIKPTGAVNEETWNRLVEVYRRQRFSGVSQDIPQI